MTPTGSTPGDDEPVVLGTLTLAGAKRSVRQARSFALDMLGPDHPALDDVRTCVSEAVTNGVMHTDSGCGGKVTVAITAVGDAIVVEVTDDGAGGERPYVRDEPLSEDGRGMLIIGVLTQAWGVRTDGVRTTVWMRFADGPPPAA